MQNKILDKIKTLHPYEIKVLKILDKKTTVSEITQKLDLQEIQVKRAVQWLSGKGLVTSQPINEITVVLGTNGKIYQKKGLPEVRFLKALSDEFTSSSDLEKKAELEKGEINIVIGTLKRKAAIDIQKDKELKIKITDIGKKQLEKPLPEENFLTKKFPILLSEIKDLDKLAYDNLKKRKDIVVEEQKKDIELELTQEGKESQPLIKNIDENDFEESLTPEMLKTGTWKNKNFRHYDVEAPVPKIFGGKQHFVNQAIEYMKQIWVELGFEEMMGTCCQTGLWDLDSLFVPQDHPARQMQDSFFLKDFSSKGILKGTLPEVTSKIKKVHEHGADTGSKGWGGTWSEDFSSEVMLRTHTTVLSAQYIHHHLKRDKQGNIIPAKFFSVNKVFRNETPDWKHLFEFNQVEGIIVDPQTNFRNLIGYLKLFFKKMGFSDVRIRPGHFPYTEPSVEVDVYNPKKKQWVELGGAGIFRPEVTKTLIGEEVPVLAWGLGMERIIVEYFELTDLRDLYKNDIKQLKEMKSWMKVSE